MYKTIKDIISHTWETGTGSNSTEQQIVYYICGVLIVLAVIIFTDLVYRIFAAFIGRK